MRYACAHCADGARGRCNGVSGGALGIPIIIQDSGKSIMATASLRHAPASSRSMPAARPMSATWSQKIVCCPGMCHRDPGSAKKHPSLVTCRICNRWPSIMPWTAWLNPRIMSLRGVHRLAPLPRTHRDTAESVNAAIGTP